ncbi:tripartite tricarboxylate transporter substrate binding protein [Variovorax guangxiensis]|uniref:Bug family tripartite tricarboxylate transporter substrate binding protein n=1 Tax=Variovorax guangxiensis TaxID=1775474 RepID=UPI00285FFE39|nr:tripartite tricarboxylate transporter substrate binding protein [Variovorax guangxiensis]MDR6860703.1 tripartite-type tricarboxylate transporter receptor subunit TctC [Variovorax guangxiensis]
MSSSFHARLTGIGALCLAVATTAAAQTFPTKPVRAVLPYSAGSGPDAVMRNVGERLGREWGHQVLVDNKPGANSWLALGEVKRAAPDGHTVLVVDATPMTLQPNLYKQLPFDPVKDFEPITPLYSTHFFIVVGANSPWKNVTDLMAAAKAKKGQVTYGSWGIGSVAHVGTAQLEDATGMQMMHVPFKELPQLYTAVATGEVDWAFGTAATVDPLYRGKKVRLLAYAGPKRLAGYEDVPTVAEAGGPAGFELRTWVALYAPKGTPKPVIDRINASVAKTLGAPEVRARFAAFGFEPWSAPPAEITRVTAADTRRFADIVKRASISLD